jgi:carboxymethylenebutenolidase
VDELVPLPEPGTSLVFGEAGAPGVVVLHDWYGRLPWLEQYGSALAGSVGLRVLVPDLYDGVATTDPDTAERLLDDLSTDHAVGVLDDAIDRLRAEGSPRVGLVGFSMGGGLALSRAQAGTVDAVVSYYATLGAAHHTLIPAPVLLHLAEHDVWPDGSEPGAFVARLLDHGTPVTQHEYPGTEHGFANASTPEVDEAAARLAFARTAAFLADQLRG